MAPCRSMRAGCVALLVAVGLLVGVAAVAGPVAAQQDAPDCSTVSYDGDGTASSPYQVTNVSQLQCVGDADTSTSLSDHFVQTSDVDASETQNWDNGDGFEPIGSSSNPFQGTYDGNGFQISGVFVDRGFSTDIGLFAAVGTDGTITRVALEDVNVTGSDNVGALVGTNDGRIVDSRAAGVVDGTASPTGGLVGHNLGSVSGSTAAVDVSGMGDTGGLAGSNDGSIRTSSATGNVEGSGTEIGGLVAENGGSIGESTASGDVTGLGNSDEVGGLVGDNIEGTINDSSATGTVTGDEQVGGLVGENDGPLRRSFATGNVTGTSDVGGLAGENVDDPIVDSYAVGSVEGSTRVGGLVGFNDGSGATVETAYAACSVAGTSDVGGLVGANLDGSVTEAYWDVETTGRNGSDGGTGLTSAAMTGSAAEANMTGFDFAATWAADAGTYPYLQANQQSPPPNPSCTGGPIDDGESDGGGDQVPDISNYRVTVDGDRITVAFDSDENLIEIDVEITGAETAMLDREDFSGNEYEGFRATYTAGTDGNYTVELVRATDAGVNDGVGDETYRGTVSVDTAPDATPTPTATAAPETPTDAATQTATATPTDAATPTAEPDTGTATDAPEPTATDEPPQVEGGGPGFGVWVALVAFGGGSYLIWRRRG